MQKDRFLTGILIGISVLIVAALILFFIRQKPSTYVDDSQPAGALQNYCLAVQKRDYERAYSYLAGQSGKPSLEAFRQDFLSYQGDAVANTTVEVGDAIIDAQDQTATVQVTLLNGNGDIFSSPSRTRASASLVRENGAWKITRAPYPFSFPDFPVEAPPKLAPSPVPTVTSAAP